MLEIINETINEKLISVFKLNRNDKIFSLLLNDIKIGYGIISDSAENTISIYIADEYQGNRYGSYLFKNLKDNIKKDLKFKIETNNIIMQRIITKNGGLEIGRNENHVFYHIKNKTH